MRTKGSYGYKEDAEEIITMIVSDIPQSTNAISNNAKETIEGIHRITVLRILRKLKDDGAIRGWKKGKIYLWCV